MPIAALPRSLRHLPKSIPHKLPHDEVGTLEIMTIAIGSVSGLTTLRSSWANWVGICSEPRFCCPASVCNPTSRFDASL